MKPYEKEKQNREDLWHLFDIQGMLRLPDFVKGHFPN